MDERPSILELFLVGAFLDLVVAVLYYKYDIRVCPIHGLESVR